MKEIFAVEPVYVAYYNIKKSFSKAYQPGEKIEGTVFLAGAEYFIDEEAVAAQISQQRIRVAGCAVFQEDEPRESHESHEYNARNNYIALKEVEIRFEAANGKTLKFPFRPDEIIPVHVHQAYVRQDLGWELENGFVKEENTVDFSEENLAEELFREDQSGPEHWHAQAHNPDGAYVATEYVKIPFVYEGKSGRHTQLVAFYAADEIPREIQKREFTLVRQDICKYVEKGLLKLAQ